MRFKKTTLAALCLAFASAAAYAAAGDRFFSNPTSNKDVVIQVNKAGVTTDVIKAVGSTGAVTVDISGSTNIHTLFGRTLLLNDVNNSGGPGLTLRAKSTAGSTENYSINVDATDNSNKGLYFDVPQGKIFFRGTSSATTGSVTGAGVWTLGPPTSSLKIGDSGKSGVALIGNRDANSFTIANSSSATFSVSGVTASVPAIVLIHNGLTGHAAIFLVSFSNISSLVAQTGGEFINSASPGAAQVGVTYANAQANVTVTTGSSQGGTFYVTVIGTNL